MLAGWVSPPSGSPDGIETVVVSLKYEDGTGKVSATSGGPKGIETCRPSV